jgi:flagellar biosynthesis GTPase FlhF
MSRRTTVHTSTEQSLPTEVLSKAEVSTEADGVETTEVPAVTGAHVSRRSGRHKPPAGFRRRPALLLAAAVAGGILVPVFAAGQPDAEAQAAADRPVSVAAQLGMSPEEAAELSDGEVADRLGELAANRSQREAAQAAAAQSQAAADQAAIEAKAAAEKAAAEQAYAASKAYAESLAAQEAAYAASVQKAEEQAAAAEKAQAAAAAAAKKQESAPAPAASGSSSSAKGSFQEYALSKLGGDQSQFSCLESLWGKESGWNPNAQNPTSTAYGIPQFLNSTWAGTGIAKTSDGYRQIDAGLIYIDSRYGSPCGAWSHSKSTGWY